MSRHHQARLRLHLLQLSHQQRRSGIQSTPFDPLPSSLEQRHTSTLVSPALDDQPRDSSIGDDGSSVTDHRTRMVTEPREAANDGSPESITGKRSSEPTRDMSPAQRRERSERLRALWRDPEWRETMLARRRTKDSMNRKSEALKQLWNDPVWREKMRQSRLGRPGPNKGVRFSAETRLRMSEAQRGRVISEETRRRMSRTKKNRSPADNWPKLISDSKKGKTRQYFAMRREFRALHQDLKLWSDSFKASYGRLPDSSTYERFVAPMMVFRIQRYLMLRDTFGREVKDDIISRQ